MRETNGKLENWPVLDDEGCDGKKGKEQHVDHVEPLASLGHRVDLKKAAHPSLLHLWNSNLAIQAHF